MCVQQINFPDLEFRSRLTSAVISWDGSNASLVHFVTNRFEPFMKSWLNMVNFQVISHQLTTENKKKKRAVLAFCLGRVGWVDVHVQRRKCDMYENVISTLNMSVYSQSML